MAQMCHEDTGSERDFALARQMFTLQLNRSSITRNSKVTNRGNGRGKNAVIRAR
jgi:hypothetical protein